MQCKEEEEEEDENWSFINDWGPFYFWNDNNNNPYNVMYPITMHGRM